jgi:hypothetical protein
MTQTRIGINLFTQVETVSFWIGKYKRILDLDDISQNEDILSDEELDAIVDFERKNLNARFSISQPELTNGQLKNLFPGLSDHLSDHWRWVLHSNQTFKMTRIRKFASRTLHV